MGKICIGIDIGASEVKFALCSGDKLLRRAQAALPDDVIREGMVVAPEAMGEFLKETRKKLKLQKGACALVLNASTAFFRRSTLPPMSVESLKLNLPYEFRDYINAEREKYVYDYALLHMEKDEQGKPVSMDIMAAAARKSTIESYRDLLKYAGFTLRIAVPEEIAYSNLIRRYEKQNAFDGRREYCILDLGHTATRLYFYNSYAHEATQLIDYGCNMLDEVIAESGNVDIHVAAAYKTGNYQNTLNTEACKAVYSKLSIDLMQALNFYNYNNPENELHDIYFCGGGAKIEPLLDALTERVSLRSHSIRELMCLADDDDDAADQAAVLYPAAYGVCLQ